MPKLDINNAQTSDYGNTVTNEEIELRQTVSATSEKETEYVNTQFSKFWGAFNKHPELKSAILMKAIWNVGKGYTADAETTVILDHISGWGKDTFLDILFNMEVGRRVARDSYAEIIRDPETQTLINLKPLDPSTIRTVVDDKGIILRYEQFNKLSKGKETKRKFQPEDIFHLSNNRFFDQICGISDIESLESTLLADLESFDDTMGAMHRQAKPFISFKLKTDDEATINNLVEKVEKIRDKGNDLFIPDDENIIGYEVVQVNLSAMVLEWRRDITNRFYRALGMPLVIFGSANSTESGSKMEYFAHEQIFEHDQKYIEEQVFNQLGLKIDLTPPTSLLNSLTSDQSKDASQGMEMQNSDMTAGVGR